MSRKQRTAKGRKQSRGKRRPRNAKASFGRQLTAGFPDKMIVNLKYSDRLALSSTAGALAYQYYRGNGPNDPDHTGAGQQPTGWDQWASFYLRYRVHYSSIEVHCGSIGTSAAAQNYIIAIGPETTNGTFANIEDAMAGAYYKFKTFNINATDNNKLSSRMYTRKILGLDKNAVKIDDTFSALTSTQPNHEWFWGVYVQSFDQSTTAVAYIYAVLTYNIEFYDRIDLSQS